MIWPAIIAAAGSVLGGVLSSNASKDASKTQARTAQGVADFQAQIAREASGNLSPFVQSGQGASSALNSFLGLPQAQPSQGGGGGAHPLYGDGNVPMTEEGIKQAYRDVLGREADPEGLQYYLTQSVKRGGGGSRLKDELTGATLLGAPGVGALFGGGDKGKRGAFTFNEFLEAAKTGPQQEAVRAGRVQPINSLADLMQPPQQQAVPGPAGTGLDTQLAYLQNHPLFQLGLQNLNEQTNAFAASRGRFGTGDTATEIFQNAMAAGGPLLNDRFNQLFSVASLGENAAAGTGNILQQGATGTGNALLQGANARAAGQVGAANARASALEGVFTQLPAIIEGIRG